MQKIKNRVNKESIFPSSYFAVVSSKFQVILFRKGKRDEWNLVGWVDCAQ
jgi:hypothetical protein